MELQNLRLHFQPTKPEPAFKRKPPGVLYAQKAEKHCTAARSPCCLCAIHGGLYPNFHDPPNHRAFANGLPCLENCFIFFFTYLTYF